MRILIKIFFLFLFVIFSSGCRYITYTPRTKQQVQREKPSVALLNRIVEFREQFNSWPFSKEEFINKGGKYRAAFEGFRYLQTTFKVIDNNTMTFYFSDHVKDAQLYEQTKKVDLNSYGGRVRFYKEKDKFIWKLKMN